MIQHGSFVVSPDMQMAVHGTSVSMTGLMFQSAGLARRLPAVPLQARTHIHERASMNPKTEWPPLIAAIAQRRDRDAFAALFEHFAPRVKALMLRSGVTETGAEELAQETMLAVWRKAASFNPASDGAAAWIFTIARNLRIDAHRRELRGGMGYVSDASMEFLLDDIPEPDAQLSALEDETRVRAALAKLSGEQMRVVELSFFEDRPHGEISQLLNIPLGTVKSRLRLAMNRLRLLLSETQ